ncbi:hypothetical protein RFI_27974 [Reticulomyxa filosa]|uniref:Palmitoyltransferase n=1 Tax=Reticulomyxa filosa TaxID=46433 RepID=X6M600_RETFI|nr:hypothetical protein RFI_27974 [Reticulomyxa filosa]|eukprot:ETO09403.1 hypothetical protein RFI_27974 [Reticulomyxa filosa]
MGRINGMDSPKHPSQVYIKALYLLMHSILYEFINEFLFVTSWVVFAYLNVNFHIAVGCYNNRQCIWMNICHFFFASVVFTSAYLATTANVVDPFLRERGYPNPLVEIEKLTAKYTKNGILNDLKWCKRCDCYVSQYSKHCRACDRCTSNFDHHCIWLNNCVSDQNYSAFFLTMTSCDCLLIYEIFLAVIVQLQNNFLNINYKQDHLFIPYSLHILLSVLLNFHIVLAGLCVFSLTQLILFHLYLICHHTTTYDWLMKRSQKSLSKEGQAMLPAKTGEDQSNESSNIIVMKQRNSMVVNPESEKPSNSSLSIVVGATKMQQVQPIISNENSEANLNKQYKNGEEESQSDMKGNLGATQKMEVVLQPFENLNMSNDNATEDKNVQNCEQMKLKSSPNTYPTEESSFKSPTVVQLENMRKTPKQSNWWKYLRDHIHITWKNANAVQALATDPKYSNNTQNECSKIIVVQSNDQRNSGQNEGSKLFVTPGFAYTSVMQLECKYVWCIKGCSEKKVFFYLEIINKNSISLADHAIKKLKKCVTITKNNDWCQLLSRNLLFLIFSFNYLSAHKKLIQQ